MQDWLKCVNSRIARTTHFQLDFISGEVIHKTTLPSESTESALGSEGETIPSPRAENGKQFS